MKKLYIVFLAFLLTSCYAWKRGFHLDENNNKYQQVLKKCEIDRIAINPLNLFYLRQVEYTDQVKLSDIDSTRAVYAIENNVRLYKSIAIGETSKSENVVEEKYMYLENFHSEVDSGRVVYFKTAPCWGGGKDRKLGINRLPLETLRNHYSNNDTIDLSTSIRIYVGKWHKEKNGNYIIDLCTNNKRFQIKAQTNLVKDRIIFTEISHPNKDKNELNSNYLANMKISETMNIRRGDSGLTYYNNMAIEEKKHKLLRKVVVTDGERSVNEIDSILFCYKTKKIKKTRKIIVKPRTFIQIDTNHRVKERRFYHKTFMFIDQFY